MARTTLQIAPLSRIRASVVGLASTLLHLPPQHLVFLAMLVMYALWAPELLFRRTWQMDTSVQLAIIVRKALKFDPQLEKYRVQWALSTTSRELHHHLIVFHVQSIHTQISLLLRNVFPAETLRFQITRLLRASAKDRIVHFSLPQDRAVVSLDTSYTKLCQAVTRIRNRTPLLIVRL